MTATCATSAKQNATTRPGITHSTSPMAIRPAAGMIVASSGPARRSTSIQVSTQPGAARQSIGDGDRDRAADQRDGDPEGERRHQRREHTKKPERDPTRTVGEPGHVGEPGLVLVLQARDGGRVGVVLVGVGQRVPGRVGGARQRGDLRR